MAHQDHEARTDSAQGTDRNPRLMIILASTRPGRMGLPLATWFTERARLHGAFDIDLVDLLALNLPLLDEPDHPRLARYRFDHTKAWSARVQRADAFVLVMPEYNYSFTAPLKNALDYLFHEWAHKPVGVLSYGGISGGTRASAAIRPVFWSLGLVSVSTNVTVPFVKTAVDEGGQVRSNDSMARAANTMLDELVVMEAALRPLRRG